MLVGVVLGSSSLVAQAGEARARVQLEVSIVGSAPPGGEGLGYFVPEVARALTEGMQRSGVAVAQSGEPISVTLEERASDRVVLSARIRGRRVEVEGPVETMDALVGETIARLLPICNESSSPTIATPAPLAATRSSARPSSHAGSATSSTEASAADAKTGSGSKDPKAASAPVATMTSTMPPVPTPPVAVTPKEPSKETPPVAPTVAAAVPPVSAPPAASATLDPYGPDAKVADATPIPPGERSTGTASFVRNRVVVHPVADPGPYVGVGSMATQALYAALLRRHYLSIVPMSAGLVAPAVAAEEGLRAQARFVVMARIDSYALFRGIAPRDGSETTIARMRLELVVVREGHQVMRRTVMAETPVDGAAAAVAASGGAADPRRTARIDPTYLAVSRALEGLAGELALAFAADGR